MFLVKLFLFLATLQNVCMAARAYQPESARELYGRAKPDDRKPENTHSAAPASKEPTTDHQALKAGTVQAMSSSVQTIWDQGEEYYRNTCKQYIYSTRWRPSSNHV
jgi:hypothetical protein